MKQYKIKYRVDTGDDYVSDSALVKAENEEAAIEKLEAYIRTTGYDHNIETVYSVKEYTADVFTSRFKPRPKNFRSFLNGDEED